MADADFPPPAGGKLVRDGLAARIPPGQLREAGPAELQRRLEDKLDEECRELRDSAFGDIGEFADVMEVLLELGRRAGFSPAAIEAARAAKLQARGGFRQGLVWAAADEASPPP